MPAVHVEERRGATVSVSIALTAEWEGGREQAKEGGCKRRSEGGVQLTADIPASVCLCQMDVISPRGFPLAARQVMALTALWEPGLSPPQTQTCTQAPPTSTDFSDCTFLLNKVATYD